MQLIYKEPDLFLDQGNLLAVQISPWLCILLLSKDVLEYGALISFYRKERTLPLQVEPFCTVRDLSRARSAH